MIRLEVGLEIIHGGVMRVRAIRDKTAVVVVASCLSLSRNPVRFKADSVVPQNCRPNILPYGPHSWLIRI